MLGMNIDDIPMWLQDQKINNVALAATSVWRYTWAEHESCFWEQ